MKFFILTILFISTLLASHIDEFATDMDYSRDFTSAVDQAKKEHKMVMLVMVADYCPWCRKFERKTLKSSKVAILIKENFIPVIMDRNLDKAKYPEEFYTPLIPNVFFIDPDDSTSYIHDSIGYVRKKEYLGSLNEAMSLFKAEKK